MQEKKSTQDKTLGIVLNLVMIALLIAIQIILSRLLSIATPFAKIGFSFIPIAVALKYLGIKQGIVVAGVSDLLGAVLFPIGAYFPGFTVTAILKAFLLGVISCKKTNFFTISLGVIVCELVCSILLNSFFISMLYGSGFIALLPGRLLQAAVMVPVQILILFPLFTNFYKRMPSSLLRHFAL